MSWSQALPVPFSACKRREARRDAAQPLACQTLLKIRLDEMLCVDEADGLITRAPLVASLLQAKEKRTRARE